MFSSVYQFWNNVRLPEVDLSFPFWLNRKWALSRWHTPGSAAVFAVFTVQVRGEKRAACTCDHSAICDQPWATAWLIYDVTGSCGKQQHGVVKKPPSPRLSPSVLISPSLHLLLPHFQISISHFRLDSPGFLYLPCHFLFFFFTCPIPASENEKSHGLFHDCIYKIRSYGGKRKNGFRCFCHLLLFFLSTLYFPEKENNIFPTTSRPSYVITQSCFFHIRGHFDSFRILNPTCSICSSLTFPCLDPSLYIMGNSSLSPESSHSIKAIHIQTHTLLHPQ